MRYAFFGTPEFAAAILQKLIEAGLPPALLVCNPDRPVGRKKILTPPPVKIIAEEKDIPFIQPAHLEPSLFAGNFDLFVVAAYGKIIPKKILDIPRLGTIGAHPSLLPKYRGATPIQSAILTGEEKTGVTLFLMDEQIDHGPVLARAEYRIRDDETYLSLHDKLANLGADLLIETLPKFVKGEYKLQPQNETAAIFTKKFEDKDGYVDLGKNDPIIVERKIRALNPEPGVWTLRKIGDKIKRMKILEAELKNGKLELRKIQFEGKKPQVL